MIYVMSGGGTGATLVVTGVAGDTCTISKDGKTKSKTFDATGKATFKGLATGAWTVTMQSASGSTATRTVVVNADYTLTITYFSATINVTYPAGSICTVTDSNTTLTAPDTTGTWACVVPNAGTWTVTATNGTYTASKTVSITRDGQGEYVELIYLLYLYNEGDECTDVTGGWRVNTTIAESAAKESNRIWTGNLLPSGNKSWIYMLNPSSRIAQFNTLKVQVDRRQITNTPTIGLMLGSTPPESLNGYTYKTLYITYKDVGNGNGELSLDISNATADSMRVMLWSFYSTYIYKIWLE